MDILRYSGGQNISQIKYFLNIKFSEGSPQGEPGGGQKTSWQRTESGRSREEVREQERKERKHNPLPV